MPFGFGSKKSSEKSSKADFTAEQNRLIELYQIWIERGADDRHYTGALPEVRKFQNDLKSAQTVEGLHRINLKFIEFAKEYELKVKK